MHSILVALLAGKAEVQYDPSVLLPSQVAGHITDLGFPSELLENQNPEGTVELEVGWSATCDAEWVDVLRKAAVLRVQFPLNSINRSRS